jgi:hypothetical protein
MGLKPYESLIYGQNKRIPAGKPGNGRENMREKTGKILPKAISKKRESKKAINKAVSLYIIKTYKEPPGESNK